MLEMPLERDEGEYAYMGQLMLEGVPPYSLAYNMKMPGVYAAYAVVLAIFGQTQSGIHLSIIFINTATIILLFFLTKKLFGPIAGAAAGVFFAITSVSRYLNATANAENFVVLPALAGILLLMKFEETKKILYLIIGGVLLGIGFMMKQHGAGFILFGLFYLIYKHLSRKPVIWKELIQAISIYSFFTVLPFLITCLILWCCGVFGKFWFWTFEYARHYVSMVSYADFFARLKGAIGTVILSGTVIWWSALFGFLSILWNSRNRKHGVLVFGLLVSSFIAICPGFYFRFHYFVLFLPVMSILAAMCIIAIQDFIGKFIKSASKTGFISILIVFAFWFQSFYSQRNYFTESDITALARANFGSNPFSEAVNVGKYIKNHSVKGDQIAILGSEPEILFYAHRRSASTYVYTYPLMEPHPYAIEMQKEMIEQIEAARPRFIVFVKFPFSWVVRRKSERLIFNWADSYVPKHYRQIGFVEVTASGQTLYHWNSVAKPLREDYVIFINERID